MQSQIFQLHIPKLGNPGNLDIFLSAAYPN